MRLYLGRHKVASMPLGMLETVTARTSPKDNLIEHDFEINSEYHRPLTL